MTSSPAGIECGGTCATSFDHGTEVTLSALPAGPGTIVWTGCDEIVGDNQCRVAMDGDKQVSARLEPVLTSPEPTPPEPAPAPSPAPAPVPAEPTTPVTKLLTTKVHRDKAKFVFASRGEATKFRCALARIRTKLRYKPCTSPVTYRNLDPGRYVFKVKAIGLGGADKTPVTRRFRIRR